MVVTVAIWLLFVLAAVRPPVRRGTVGFAVFVLTIAFNEIPLLLLAAFVLVLSFGDHPSGTPELIVGTALAALAAVGLIWLQVRARSTRAALQNGLDYALGQSWRTAQPSNLRPGGLQAVPWRQGILLPFQRRTRGVERVRNRSYGPDRAHRVDIYRAASQQSARPVLIHLHGGGFVSGRKSRESITMLNRLATDGWLCLSANYRLRGAGHHPNPLVDTKRLIAWTKDNAAELGADRSQIYVYGCSAGGHLAVSAALTPGQDELQPGFEAADTTVAAVIACYGYLGPRTADPSSSPAQLARPDAPPMLIIHGRNDTAIPVEDARAIAVGLEQASRNPVVFVELPAAQHSFDLFASVRSRITADGVAAFLDWARRRVPIRPTDATHDQ